MVREVENLLSGADVSVDQFMLLVAISESIGQLKSIRFDNIIRELSAAFFCI